MDLRYPCSCPFGHVPVDMRQLVGGAWDMFELRSAIQCHRCPHPTDLYRRRQMPSRPPVAPVAALPSKPALSASPSGRPQSGVPDRSPRPDRPKAEISIPKRPHFEELAIVTAHRADGSGMMDPGTCVMCGARIAAASSQDLCAGCLSHR